MYESEFDLLMNKLTKWLTMDKKKVIELIKKGISYWNRSTYITSYEDDAKECFNEAIKELSKSDWISVEERFPEYGEKENRVLWIE